MRSKNIFIFLCVVTALADGGCKKFLDKNLLGDYTTTNYFTSDANASFPPRSQ